MVPALGNCFVEKNKTLFCHTLLDMDSFNIPCLPLILFLTPHPPQTLNDIILVLTLPAL